MGGCASSAAPPAKPIAKRYTALDHIEPRNHKQYSALGRLPAALQALIASFLRQEDKVLRFGHCSIAFHNVLRMHAAWTGWIRMTSSGQIWVLSDRLRIPLPRVSLWISLGHPLDEYRRLLHNVTDLRVEVQVSQSTAWKQMCRLTALDLARIELKQVGPVARQLATLSTLRSVKMNVFYKAGGEWADQGGPFEALAALPLHELRYQCDAHGVQSLLPALAQAGTPLRVLRLSGIRLPASQFEPLSRLTALTDVSLREAVASHGMGVWQHLPPSVTALGLNCQTWLAGAPRLRSLRSLTVEGTESRAHVDVAVLEPLAECSMLERLELIACLPDEKQGLEPLSRCVALRTLVLSRMLVKSSQFRELEAATQLRSLTVNGVETIEPDDASAVLGPLSNLAELTLSCYVRGECLAALAESRAPLVRLRIDIAGLTTQHLAAVPQLKRLRLLTVGRLAASKCEANRVWAELGIQHIPIEDDLPAVI